MAVQIETPRVIEFTPRDVIRAGEDLVFQLPANGRYKGLHFFAEDAGADTSIYPLVEDIEVQIDNKQQREHTPAQLAFINQSRGRYQPRGLTGSNNMLSIHFSEPQRGMLDERDALGWGMGDVADFRVNLKMVDPLPAGAFKIRCFGVVDSGIDTQTGRVIGLGNIVKYIRRQENVAAAQDWHEIRDLPLNRGAYMGQYFFEDGTTVLDEYRLELDRTRVIEDISFARHQDIFTAMNPQFAQNADVNAIEDPDGDALITETAHAIQLDKSQDLLQILGVGTVTDFKPEIYVSAGATKFDMINEIVGARD